MPKASVSYADLAATKHVGYLGERVEADVKEP